MKKPKVLKIGGQIRNIRKSYGYTQEKLAEKIECSTRYISDIEQDKVRPSYEVLIKICNTFQIEINDIFSEYLDVKGRKKENVALKGFTNLKERNQATILHLIEYFNKENR